LPESGMVEKAMVSIEDFGLKQIFELSLSFLWAFKVVK
jgi:hypothetical protein